LILRRRLSSIAGFRVISRSDGRCSNKSQEGTGNFYDSLCGSDKSVSIHKSILPLANETGRPIVDPIF
jgi:hypothetical protein